MSQALPFSPMLGVYEQLTAIIRSTFEQPNHKAERNVIQDTLRTAANLRSFVVQGEADLASTWQIIRTHTATLDFLMDVTTQLHLVTAHSLLPFDQIVAGLAASLGAHRPEARVAKKTVVDSDLLQRMPDKKAAEELLLSNPWYVTLLLISHRPTLIAEQQ